MNFSFDSPAHDSNTICNAALSHKAQQIDLIYRLAIAVLSCGKQVLSRHYYLYFKTWGNDTRCSEPT
jgi:hypothetical protein